MNYTAPKRLMNGDLSRRVCWIAIFIAAMVLLIPFWLIDVPPLLDYPDHLARMYVLAHPENNNIRQFYTPHWGILPYIAVDALSLVLQRFLSIYLTGKVILVFALMLPVAGTCLFNKALASHWSWWPVISSVIAYNTLFLLGFYNYCISFGLALCLASLWVRYRNSHPVRSIALASIIAACLFFVHVYGDICYLVLIGSAELVSIVRPQTTPQQRFKSVIHRGVWLGVIAVPVCALSYLSGNLSGAHHPPIWQSSASKISEIFFGFLQYDKSYGMVCAILLFSLLYYLYIKDYVRFHPVALVASVVLFVMFLATPFRVADGAFFSTRFAVMSLFVLIGGMVAQNPLPRITARLVAASVAALAILQTAGPGIAWYHERKDLSDLRQAMQSVEPGSRVLNLLSYRVDGPAWWDSAPSGRLLPMFPSITHYPALLTIEHDSFWPFMFTLPNQEAIRRTEKVADSGTDCGFAASYKILDLPNLDTLPDVPEYLVHWQQKFDYVLILGAGAIPNSGHLYPDKLDPIRINDFAALYKIKRQK